MIDLNHAVGLAAEYGNLSPSNFSLAAAVFVPGTVVNSSLSSDPNWDLYFARTYQGFWTFGSCGNGAFSLAATVDALTGSVKESAAPYCEPASSSGITGSFELNVNSSRALQVVRASSLQQVPTDLTRNGTVTQMSPRIVLFGPSSNNAAFQNPLNGSLSGSYDLCWVVEMSSPTPGYGYQGTFAVDARTGVLVSGWAEELYPSTTYADVFGSLNYSSASGLTVSQESFEVSGSVVGSQGSLPVTVQDVVVVRPGSTASIGLNFSSTFTENITVDLSFANPLPGIESLSNGLPSGVSIGFSPSTLDVPASGRAITQLLISVPKSAQSGTYLLEVDAALHDPSGNPQGTSRVLFFFSVWDGTGQWPSPPTIR